MICKPLIEEYQIRGKNDEPINQMDVVIRVDYQFGYKLRTLPQTDLQTEIINHKFSYSDFNFNLCMEILDYVFTNRNKRRKNENY